VCGCELVSLWDWLVSMPRMVLETDCHDHVLRRNRRLGRQAASTATPHSTMPQYKYPVTIKTGSSSGSKPTVNILTIIAKRRMEAMSVTPPKRNTPHNASFLALDRLRRQISGIGVIMMTKSVAKSEAHTAMSSIVVCGHSVWMSFIVPLMAQKLSRHWNTEARQKVVAHTATKLSIPRSVLVPELLLIEKMRR
jgi:hypothetical protein